MFVFNRGNNPPALFRDLFDYPAEDPFASNANWSTSNSGVLLTGSAIQVAGQYFVSATNAATIVRCDGFLSLNQSDYRYTLEATHVEEADNLPRCFIGMYDHTSGGAGWRDRVAIGWSSATQPIFEYVRNDGAGDVVASFNIDQNAVLALAGTSFTMQIERHNGTLTFRIADWTHSIACGNADGIDWRPQLLAGGYTKIRFDSALLEDPTLSAGSALVRTVRRS